MARPKKDKELRHKHQIMLRLTDTEYEIISESAKAANLPLAEYVRKQVMKQKVIAKYEIVADLPELKKLAAEFGVAWLPSDFKKKDGYKRSIELSKEYDLYRQDYCGCVYSRAERDRRKKLDT